VPGIGHSDRKGRASGVIEIVYQPSIVHESENVEQVFAKFEPSMVVTTTQEENRSRFRRLNLARSEWLMATNGDRRSDCCQVTRSNLAYLLAVELWNLKIRVCFAS
jgi:hypothetical protein